MKKQENFEKNRQKIVSTCQKERLLSSERPVMSAVIIKLFRAQLSWQQNETLISQ